MRVTVRDEVEWMLSMARWILKKEQALKLKPEFVVVLENVRANLEVLMDMEPQNGG